LGHAVAQLVEALRCKPEGRGFDLLQQVASRATKDNPPVFILLF
jgi:hypothetical protein